MRVWAGILLLTACNGSSPDGGSSKSLVDKVATAIANGDDVHGTAKGHFQSSGATGAWSFDQARCYSGDLHDYFGARIETRDDDGIQITVVKDPLKGWAMKVNRADTCKTGSTEQCKARTSSAS